MALTLIKHDINFDFTGWRRAAYALSLFIILAGIVATVLHGGLRYGVDFAGGVIVQMQFDEPVQDETVKRAVSGIDLPGLTVQHMGGTGADYMLRFSAGEEGAAENLRRDLNAAFADNMPGVEAGIERLEMVGPKVGGDLRNMAVEALFYAVLLITVYISGRFEHSWFVAAGICVVMWAVVWLVKNAVKK